MQRQASVQHKISCLFETVVVQEKSTKRSHQPFKVVAGTEVKESAVGSDISNSFPSEKLDGTCVYIGEYQGKPWLWARLDRKPNKPAEKKFKKYQGLQRDWELAGKPDGGCPPPFVWDVEKDFKEVPGSWIPAHGVEREDGNPQPDVNGHIPGWVPVEMNSRQYCWHLTTVDLEAGLAIVLRPNGDSAKCSAEPSMEITIVPLSDLNECTVELIGTNINANPYKLGSKQHPLHLLTVHASFGFSEPPPLDYHQLKAWFMEAPEGKVEGVVWHCSNLRMFKVHRHHLELPWPVADPQLSNQSVIIKVDLSAYPHTDFTNKPLFQNFGKLNSKVFNSLCELNFDATPTVDGTLG